MDAPTFRTIQQGDYNVKMTQTSSGFLRGIALAAYLGVAACGEEAPAPEPVDTIEGITITDARLVLPPVSGNPAAVYFNLSYDGERGIAVSGAEVAGAKNATVHDMMEYDFKMTMAEAGPVPLTNGTEVAFEPGAKHVMAFELDDSVQAGGTAEVTLKISGGKRHKFEAEVRAAGEER